MPGLLLAVVEETEKKLFSSKTVTSFIVLLRHWGNYHKWGIIKNGYFAGGNHGTKKKKALILDEQLKKL